MFRLRRRYIKHSRQCFIGYPKTSNFVKNTPLHVVFSNLLPMFGNVMKHCLSCLIYITSSSTNNILPEQVAFIHDLSITVATAQDTTLQMKKDKLLLTPVSHYSQLADTPLLWIPAITDKIQPPGESYRGLTENDSRNNGITDILKYQLNEHNITHFQRLPERLFSHRFLGTGLCSFTLLVPFPSRL